MLRLAPPAALAIVFVAWAPTAEAQRNCRKGKPFGNTCIARDKVCRIGSPSTVDRDTPTEQQSTA